MYHGIHTKFTGLLKNLSSKHNLSKQNTVCRKQEQKRKIHDVALLGADYLWAELINDSRNTGNIHMLCAFSWRYQKVIFERFLEWLRFPNT